jgi:diaminopimelate epimerase
MVTVEKYHGTGNDFLVVDARERVPDRRAFARALCDREAGVSHPDADRTGADGVLFLALETDPSPPRVVMTLVQPDGSIAAMCGNGARCAARWVADRTGTDEVMIDTQSGTRRATLGDAGIRIQMGEPSFAPQDVPLARDEPLVETELAGLAVTAVDTGVPHAVAFVDDVAAVDLETVGPEIRHAEVFPEGANATFASPRDDAADRNPAVAGFDQRTYERGVEGETGSCGTGAVAIGTVAERLGLVEAGDRVPIHPPGGRLVVEVAGDDATLTGPVEHEFAAEVPARPTAADAAGD